MPNSPEFVSHAVDLLSLLGPVQARAMFGGHGLYCRGVMFGLLDDDELFLKTDDACRARFEEAGCRRWVYESRSGPMETGYFRPPDGAHEDPEAMLPWSRLALDAALRKAVLKASKAMRPKAAAPKAPRAKATAKPARRAPSRAERRGPRRASRPKKR
ncbi:MAG TPA: TfoX/Sxy family protein [Anaeromyxobacter sp.]|nr:TfoX/Sxy family protein [Anaeromyxobacter sp.]